MANEKGVWRTIGGRRVFIKEGQDLASAMKESGKFKTSKKTEDKKDHTFNMSDEDKEKYEKVGKKIDDLTKEIEDKDKVLEDFKNSDGSKENFEKALNKISEMEYENKIGPDDYKESISKIQKEYVEKNRKATNGKNPIEDMANDRIKEKENTLNNDKILLDGMKKRGMNEINGTTQADLENRIKKNEDYLKVASNKEQFSVSDLKKKAQATLPKEDIDTHEGDLYLKKTKESTELLNNMKDKDSGLLTTFKDQETGETWYDIPFANMGDDYKEKSSNDIMNEKIRSRGKSKVEEDDLPKRTEIKTQGTSNRKEVSENIQAHILDYYSSDFTGEDIPATEAFVRQMDAMDWLPNNWKRGEEIAKGGSYLIYNQDMADFLDELKINPKGKTFSEDKAFDMYTSLIGRESAKLYDRIQKNSYKKYMKAHPLSKMSFEEFKDMNKK